MSSADLVIKNHQGIKAEIEARADRFSSCVDMGQGLLARSHYAAEEVGEAWAKQVTLTGRPECWLLLRVCLLLLILSVLKPFTIPSGLFRDFPTLFFGLPLEIKKWLVRTYYIAHVILVNVVWWPGWEGDWGENGYMCMYG